MAAEDILSAALAYGTLWQLLRKGLRKSWALPAIERRYRVDRKNIAFIDDRLDNIEDLVGNGVGLALHAPSGINNDGSIITFDFQQVAGMLREGSGERMPPILSIAPRIVTDSELNRTGIGTGTFTTESLQPSASIWKFDTAMAVEPTGRLASRVACRLTMDSPHRFERG